MGSRDPNWPGYTQWYCCPGCRRLWTFQAQDILVLDPSLALGPATPSAGVPSRVCSVCEGHHAAVTAEI